MNLFKFISSKWFLANIILSIIVFFIGVFVVLNLLKEVTLHDESITVPNLETYSLDEVDKTLSELSLTYKIIDSSAYTPKFPKNSIIKQDPRPNSKVKDGRTIYLTINSGGYSSVKIPYLIGKTNRQAVSYLKAIGFRIGKFEYRRDIGKNVVLDVKYDGEIIDTLTSLPKRSIISLVLGTGLGNKNTNLPNLAGVSLKKAKDKLVEVSLNLGHTNFDEQRKPNTKYYVYKQHPKYAKNAKLRMGTTVDIWITSDTLKVSRIKEEILISE